MSLQSVNENICRRWLDEAVTYLSADKVDLDDEKDNGL